ncbi:uncharacterized protein JCM15063_002762 [Sporobolomyces koalae]|uniref:uncharacterized protein n=1 Tax=Sporobolomyces koalae TaxID=500713 RepID=UPI00316B3947
MPATLLSTDGTITAPLKYFKATKDGERPYQLMFESDTIPDNNFVRADIDLPIHDLRPLLADPEARKDIGIETTGFAVPDAAISGTSMQYEDWQDEDKIKSTYYPEVSELLKKVTGGTKVIIFDHTIRRGERAGEETPDTPSSRKPVTAVHVDQTPLSGKRRVLRHAKEEGLDGEKLLRGRAQLINVWRPLRGPVLDVPLAVADFRTLDIEKDLVSSRLVYPAEGEPGYQPEGETFTIKFSERHKWYYVPEMQPNEVLLLKCWENTENGGVRTPHTAFNDPRYYGRDDVPLRQSIEIRALVFHPPDE